jgi:hypothetical protein
MSSPAAADPTLPVDIAVVLTPIVRPEPDAA